MGENVVQECDRICMSGILLLSLQSGVPTTVLTDRNLGRWSRG